MWFTFAVIGSVDLCERGLLSRLSCSCSLCMFQASLVAFFFMLLILRDHPTITNARTPSKSVGLEILARLTVKSDRAIRSDLAVVYHQARLFASALVFAKIDVLYQNTNRHQGAMCSMHSFVYSHLLTSVEKMGLSTEGFKDLIHANLQAPGVGLCLALETL